MNAYTRDVEKAINELLNEEIDGILIDLRSNGGGSLQEVVNMTDLFIEPGPIVSIKTPKLPLNKQSRSYQKAKYRGPLVVLVDKSSAGASEILAGTIQDYQRGIIVGSQTFGMGTLQSVRPLSKGTLKVTESMYFRVTGEPYQLIGVTPDTSLPDVYLPDFVGEKTYQNVAQKRAINKLSYSPSGDLEKIIEQLNKGFSSRKLNNKDIDRVEKLLSKRNRVYETGTISLNLKNQTDIVKERKRIRSELENIDLDEFILDEALLVLSNYISLLRH